MPNSQVFNSIDDSNNRLNSVSISSSNPLSLTDCISAAGFEKFVWQLGPWTVTAAIAAVYETETDEPQASEERREVYSSQPQWQPDQLKSIQLK